MGKKMKKLPFLFKTSSIDSSWPWHYSCGIANNPKTLSFRVDRNHNNNNMLMNSTYYVDEHYMCSTESISSSSSTSASTPALAPAPEETTFGDYVENMIRGSLRSERLFFEPRSSKLLEDHHQEVEVKMTKGRDKSESSIDVLKESVEMEMASSNPFVDFRRSMEEMMEAQGYGDEGFQDWKFLEELLACYLRINGKTNHGYIVGAFVDLLVHLFMDHPNLANNHQEEGANYDDTITNVASSSSLASSSSFTLSSSNYTNNYGHCLLSSSSTSTSNTHSTFITTSPLSFCSNNFPTSPSLSLLEEVEDDIIVEKSIDIINGASSSSSPSHLV